MKRTGKRIASLCLLILALVLLVSCNAPPRALCGRWETEIEDEELGKVAMVYHFTEDGEIFLEQKKGDTIPFSIPFGTYGTKGDSLTIESDGAKKVYTFSVEKDLLTLSSARGEDLVFHRV